MIGQPKGITQVIYLASWGEGYDCGYSAGRYDALGDGVTGVLEEVARLKKALATIGKRGDPLPATVARRIAREALDRTGTREERRKGQPRRSA